LVRHLLRVSRPCWPHLAGIAALALLSVPIALLLPLPLKIAVDCVIGKHALPDWLAWLTPLGAGSRGGQLAVAIGLLLLLTIVSNLQTMAAWLLQTYTGEKLVLDLRSRLFWHAQRLSMASHDATGTTEVAYRLQHDAPAIQFILIQGIIPLVTAALSFAAMLLVTAQLDRSIAYLALAMMPIMIAIGARAGYHTRSGWESVKQLDSSAMRIMTEALAGIRVVKAFGREDMEDARFHLRSRQRMGRQVRLAFTQASYHLLTVTVLAGSSAATLWIAVGHVLRGTLTLGELLLIMSYVAQLYEPVKTVSGKLPEMQSWMVSAYRAFSLLEQEPEAVTIARTPAPSERSRGDVVFSGVGFRYRPGRLVLNDVSFAIPAGTRVGIMGASGSGKSTLASLLTRFYDPCAGQITLDGRDLRSYTLPDLRAQFSILTQDAVIFSVTIAENIAYGRPEATRAEVIAAARAANADEFITALPNGYDTLVGDSGVPLSGGQRQRLAIARAFLKDAPILLLDEPTSALDARNERDIIAAIQELMCGRTTFIIAHRVQTVRSCDRLLVVHEGRLIEETADFEKALGALLTAGVNQPLAISNWHLADQLEPSRPSAKCQVPIAD
jgi:ATP-binding cassette, subfamily B, bacterial